MLFRVLISETVRMQQYNRWTGEARGLSPIERKRTRRGGSAEAAPNVRGDFDPVSHERLGRHEVRLRELK